MRPLIHKISAILALCLIASFWVATVISEIFLDPPQITLVKTLIPYGFLLLIPALALTGATGMQMGRRAKTGPVLAKRKRMPFIAANGILVLVPVALILAVKARQGQFDSVFYLLQGVELLFGAINLCLIGLNIRDGRRITAARHPNTEKPRQIEI
ncbi:MAG: hypothetical protein ACPGNV_06955 [Mangrovicoccus sp.]